MNSFTGNSKPVGVLRDAKARLDADGNILQLEGVCVSHDWRKDLVGGYMYSSLVLNEIGEDRFETRNSVYQVLNWAKPELDLDLEELARIEKYFASLIA